MAIKGVLGQIAAKLVGMNAAKAERVAESAPTMSTVRPEDDAVRVDDGTRQHRDAEGLGDDQDAVKHSFAEVGRKVEEINTQLRKLLVDRARSTSKVVRPRQTPWSTTESEGGFKIPLLGLKLPKIPKFRLPSALRTRFTNARLRLRNLRISIGRRLGLGTKAGKAANVVGKTVRGASKVGRVLGGTALPIIGGTLYGAEDYIKHGDKSHALTVGGGATAGIMAGGWAGAKAGALAGSLAGPWGAAIGGVIGGIGGSIVGGMGGAELGGWLDDKTTGAFQAADPLANSINEDLKFKFRKITFKADRIRFKSSPEEGYMSLGGMASGFGASGVAGGGFSGGLPGRGGLYGRRSSGGGGRDRGGSGGGSRGPSAADKLNDRYESAIQEKVRQAKEAMAAGDEEGARRLGHRSAQLRQEQRRAASQDITEKYPAELGAAIKQSADDLGIDAEDLATMISFETGGTFDPWKKGPTTKWGEHRGLIQWGEPQREKYGVYEGMPIGEQMKAVTQYLKDHGVKPGMSGVNVYAAINAGNANKTGASDSAAGGTWGTVADKWNHQMGGHRRKAQGLMATAGDVETSGAFIPTLRDDEVPAEQVAATEPSTGDRVSEIQGRVAATRKLDIQQDLRDQLEFAAAQADIRVEVTSGGQAGIGEGGPRTGSTRHDHGGAADVRLYRMVDGEKQYLHMTNPDDAAVMKEFTRQAVRAGATGVGAGYMGSRVIHVGGGTSASWGGADWIGDAHEEGTKLREEDPVDLAEWKKEKKKSADEAVEQAAVVKPVAATMQERTLGSYLSKMTDGDFALPAVTPPPMEPLPAADPAQKPKEDINPSSLRGPERQDRVGETAKKDERKGGDVVATTGEKNRDAQMHKQDSEPDNVTFTRLHAIPNDEGGD